MTDRGKPAPEELRTRLTPLQYHVTQEKGTERPFTGQYAVHNDVGTYYCVVCGTDLFESEKKFDAGCGWPSFWLPLAGDRVRSTATPRTAWSVPKSPVRTAMRIWDMCSMTAPNPRACGTALIPPRWASAGNPSVGRSMPVAEPVTLAGTAGVLEAIAEIPADAVADSFMVICHPHPLHGGTMTNKVVTTLARTAHELAVPTLRFNFRGIGASAGSFDEGRGETDDALAAIAWGAPALARCHLVAGGIFIRWLCGIASEHHAWRGQRRQARHRCASAGAQLRHRA